MERAGHRPLIKSVSVNRYHDCILSYLGKRLFCLCVLWFYEIESITFLHRVWKGSQPKDRQGRWILLTSQELLIRSRLQFEVNLPTKSLYIPNSPMFSPLLYSKLPRNFSHVNVLIFVFFKAIKAISSDYKINLKSWEKCIWRNGEITMKIMKISTNHTTQGYQLFKFQHRDCILYN